MQVMFDGIGGQKLAANFRRVFIGGADSIEDFLGFNLTSVSCIIDYNWWEDIWTVFSPVLKVFVNKWVCNIGICPSIFSWYREAISYTLLNCFPIDCRQFSHCISRTICIKGWSTRLMNLFHIFPKLKSCCRCSISCLINTHFSEIFQYNFLTCQLGCWICTIFSSTKAMLG